jgi:hypothetical protein
MPTEQTKEDLDRPIWGVVAIAEAANLSPRQTYHALEAGYLPASKAGRKWVTTPRRLRAAFQNNNDPPHYLLPEGHFRRRLSVRLLSGLSCPFCRTRLRNIPEETSDGWRIGCSNSDCQRDFLIVEEVR